MSKKIILGIFVFLLVCSMNVYAENIFDREDRGYGLFGVTLLEQSPPVVPAIALEHRSYARVKLFLSVFPLDLGTGDYRIKHVSVGLAEPNKYVSSITKDWTAPEEDDLDYDNYFALGDDKIVVANVKLNRVGSGKRVIIEEDTAEQICANTTEPGPEIGEAIPDVINVSLRIKVTFSACVTGFDDEGNCPGGYMTWRDFRVEDYQYETQKRIEDCVDSVHRRYANKEDKGGLDDEIARCYESYERREHLITDTVYFDTVVGVDKTNLDHAISPEELRSQICRTIKWRDGLQKWIDGTKKAERVFDTTCLASVLGATISYVLKGNPCDAMDWISLGCDWIFCPSEGCNDVDPMGSIIASTTMCWDFKKPFFGKTLGLNLKEDFPSGPGVIEETIKEGGEEKTYKKTFDQSIISSKDDYSNKFCDYKSEAEKAAAKPKIPHYACITGVRGNLEIIDLVIEQYQECLIKARQGGISVGICDKLRSYYLCDRVLAEVLPWMGERGTQGSIAKIFGKIISAPVNLVTGGQAGKFFEDRKDGARDIMDMSIAKYRHVPFLQLLSGQKQFLREKLCYAFVEGSLFDLEDFKEQFNLLDVEYPDSATVNTERRVWDWYRVKDISEYDIPEEDLKGLLSEVGEEALGTDVSEQNFVPAEWSYDVFFAIYNGEKGIYGEGGHYSVYLTDLTSYVPGKGCGGNIEIARGYIKHGEMVMDNVFKVHRCRANKQCLRFKDKLVCREIGETLSLDSRQYDPLGLGLFSEDDNNNNGVSDNWEARYFGIGKKVSLIGDKDGDGYCNAQEYLAGTDPANKYRHPIGEAECGPALQELAGRVDGVNPVREPEEEEETPPVEEGDDGGEDVAEDESCSLGREISVGINDLRYGGIFPSVDLLREVDLSNLNKDSFVDCFVENPPKVSDDQEEYLTEGYLSELAINLFEAAEGENDDMYNEGVRLGRLLFLGPDNGGLEVWEVQSLLRGMSWCSKEGGEQFAFGAGFIRGYIEEPDPDYAYSNGALIYSSMVLAVDCS